MSKFLSYICAFLCVVIFIYYQKNNMLTTKNTALKTDIQQLSQELDIYKQQIKFTEEEIKKRDERELEASRQRQELEELAKQSTEPCWNHNISDSDPILIRLRADRVRL